MAKLIEDPKVQALVEKEVAKAVKAKTKRCVEAVKSTTAAWVEANPGSKKALNGLGKAIVAAVKG